MGVVAVTQRVDGERQLVGLVIDVLPATGVRDVSRRVRRVLGLHATIHDGGTCALPMGRQLWGCGNGISIIQIIGTSTPSTNSVVQLLLPELLPEKQSSNCGFGGRAQLWPNLRETIYFNQSTIIHVFEARKPKHGKTNLVTNHFRK